MNMVSTELLTSVCYAYCAERSQNLHVLVCAIMFIVMHVSVRPYASNTSFMSSRKSLKAQAGCL